VTGTNPAVDEWFAEQQNNPLIDALQLARELIMSADHRVEESIKWKTPTFAYKGNIVSFTLGAKNLVSLMFHKGAKIPSDHPGWRATGSRCERCASTTWRTSPPTGATWRR
jgi:hypothetical protein